VERGRLVHRLLQSLPDMPPGERAGAARRFLARSDADPALADEVLGLLADPSFGAVFAEGGRAEVAILGRLPGPAGEPARLVSGRIDRLCIGSEDILIVDFKTHRSPPADLAEVPEEQTTQLALYRAVLMRLYPARRVRAALLFTAGPRLIEVPEARMDALAAAALRGPSPRTSR
jgi:ATP-dependent helicase/nuclease subunit A